MKTLLRQLKNDKAVISSSAEQIFPIFISQNKIHEEKDRLKVFLPKRGWQLAKKKQNKNKNKK